MERKDLDSVPSVDDLKDLAKELTSNWYFLGIRLEVELATINGIRDNVKNLTPEMNAFQMLNVWREKGSSSTYRKLAKALELEDKGLLAEKYSRAGDG